LEFYHPKTKKKKKKNQTGRKKKKKPTHGRRDPAMGLGGKWVYCKVSGRGRDPSGKTQPWVSSFRRDPSLNHRKEKKKIVGLTDPQSARPNGGSRWPATLHRGLPSPPFSSFSFLSLLHLFSLFYVSCSHAVGSRIFFCIFFSFCEVTACKWWA
jgi:hypothetical protein